MESVYIVYIICSIYSSVIPGKCLNRICQHSYCFAMFSNTIRLPMLSACFSYGLLSPRVPCCVCDTLSSWSSLTVFPVEQNKPQPEGFLMSKHRPQRIILIDCWVPRVVLWSHSCFTVNLVSASLAMHESKNAGNKMWHFNINKSHFHFFSFVFAIVNTDKWVAVSRGKTLGWASSNEFDVSGSSNSGLFRINNRTGHTVTVATLAKHIKKLKDVFFLSLGLVL